MTEMVKRVGVAIAETFAQLSSNIPYASSLDESASEALAMAAIQAMREPTPEITKAMGHELAYVNSSYTSAWRAGIGAACGESDGPAKEPHP